MNARAHPSEPAPTPTHFHPLVGRAVLQLEAAEDEGRAVVNIDGGRDERAQLNELQGLRGSSHVVYTKAAQGSSHQGQGAGRGEGEGLKGLGGGCSPMQITSLFLSL